MALMSLRSRSHVNPWFNKSRSLLYKQLYKINFKYYFKTQFVVPLGLESEPYCIDRIRAILAVSIYKLLSD